MAKAYPLSTEIARETIEKSMFDENPRYVLVALIMYDAGLRTAEAAAVTDANFRPLDCNGHHTTSLLQVEAQEKGGKRCRIPKSDSAHRTAILSHWGHIMVQHVLNYLEVSDSSWPQTPTDSKSASAWILQKLQDLGVCPKDLSDTATSLFSTDKRSLLSTEDLSAYILRRDCATRLAFRCGLSLHEIDILLGHVRHTRKSSNAEYRKVSWQQNIACKLERYVHMPEYSASPECMPYSLSPGTTDIHIPYPTHCYCNRGNHPLRVAIAIEAKEPGEAITLRCSDGTALTISMHRT